MPSPFGSFPFDAAGIDNFVHPALITAQRAPTNNDIYPIGTQWADASAATAIIYEYVGGPTAWATGGNAYATTSAPGIVTLSSSIAGDASSLTLVPTVKEIKDYVDGVAIAGAPVATTTVQGIVTLATDVKAVAGTASTGLVALAVQPSNLAAVFAAPSAIGGTTPAAGAFTTLAFTTLAGSAGGNWLSGGTTINIGSDASNDAINIGTAGTRTIIIGDNTSTTNVALNVGTGALNLGTDAIAHIVTLGNTTGASAVNINTGTAGSTITTTNGIFSLLSGTGTISIGADAADHVINIGNSTGATPVSLNGGTSGVNVGTNAIAHTVTVGNLTGASEVLLNFGTNGLVTDGVASSPLTMMPSTTSGAITIGGTAQSTGVITLGSSSTTSTVKIASGAGNSTVTIAEGTAGTNVVSILNGATVATGTVNILSGAGSAGGGALHMADNGRVTAISLANVAPAAARTTSMFGGNAAQNDTVTMWAGNPSANTQSLAIFGGVASAGTQTISLMSGTQSGGTQTVNVFNGNATGGTPVLNLVGSAAATTIVTTNINTGAAAHVLNIGTATAGAQTWTVGTGNLSLVGSGNTIGLANDAAANLITIGSITAGASLTLRAGTVGILLTGAVTTPYTIGTATGTGLINIGLSTAGEVVAINNAASNTVANEVRILNGATPGADNTLNVMNGAGTAGTQTVNILASGATRAGAINLGTGAAVHVITIGQVTSLLHVNGPQTNTLASGAATALSLVTSAGTGRCLDMTSSGVTVPDLLSNVGGLKVTPTAVTAGASPQICSNRHGSVIFSGVSIAASANQVFTITNTVVTAGSYIMVNMYGATDGAALTISAVTPGAGTFNVTVKNGAGASTTTANINFVFWVLN